MNAYLILRKKWVQVKEWNAYKVGKDRIKASFIVKFYWSNTLDFLFHPVQILFWKNNCFRILESVSFLQGIQDIFEALSL